MTEPSRAVFLSYASQDAEAAARICASLRAAGIEVWIDQSELRGGDVWDRHIRKQIHDCTMFIPIISANTQSRLEGYFRLEWKLAVERTHLMADGKPFLVPVVIDAKGIIRYTNAIGEGLDQAIENIIKEMETALERVFA